MKIVVLDGYGVNPGDISWDEYEKLGNVEIYDSTPRDRLLERAIDADVIFTNATKIDRAFLDKADRLKYIGILSTGFNTVDVDYAKKKGIVVTNVPGYGTASVSQHAIALLLEITNSVFEQSRQVKAGEWEESGYWSFINRPMIELEKKTMGIIGYGRIGKRTGGIARALGMKLLVNKRNIDNFQDEENLKFSTKEEIFRKSDVIVLHCPLNRENYHMINKEAIEMMKDGVIIINNSRGKLLDEEAVLGALRAGKIYALGLDVLEKEPASPENPLLLEERVFVTPHSSWGPVEARSKLLGIALDNYKNFLEGNIKNSL